MFLLSRLKFFVLTIITVFLVSITVLAVTPSQADAAPVSKVASNGHYQRIAHLAQYQTSFPEGVLGVAANRTLQSDDGGRETHIAADIACTLTGPIGGMVSVFTDGICNTPISAVTDRISDALDCASSPMECVTDWIYKAIGGMVSWAANGVVTLVAGVNEECIAEGSEGWNGTNTVNCEDRIALDYLPQGSAEAARVATQFQNANDARLDELAIQLAAASNDAERTQIMTEINTLAQNVAAQENRTFYTPKSSISTPTFEREYGKYVSIAGMLLIPMVIAAALQAVITGKGGLMARSVVLHLPLAIFGMLSAPYFVRLLMRITDGMSAYVLSDVRQDVDGFFTNIGDKDWAVAGLGMLLPFFLIALVFAVAAMMIWFILNMREASIALITIFMPIAFAASIWPALGKWVIRGIKLLVAAIISKVFIVGALALGLGTFAGATDAATQGGQSGISFSHLVYGSIIFFVAAFSPQMVTRFFDEIGDAMHNNGSSGGLAKGLAVAGAYQTMTGKGLGGMLGKGNKAGAEGSGGAGGGGSSSGSDAKSEGVKAGLGALDKGASPSAAAKKAYGATRAHGGSAKDAAAAAAAVGKEGGMSDSQANFAAAQLAGNESMAKTGDPVAAGVAGGEAAIAAGASPQEAGNAAAAIAAGHEYARTGSTTAADAAGASARGKITISNGLPPQSNRMSNFGAKQLAQGKIEGSKSRQVVGAAALTLGHVGRPLTLISPVAGGVRGAALAAKNISDIRNAAG